MNKKITLLAAASLLVLAACGGSETDMAQAQSAAVLQAPAGEDASTHAGAGTVAGTDAGTDAAAEAALQALASHPGAREVAQPQFHLAPVQLAAPSQADADGSSSSALQAPHQQGLARAMAAVNTSRLLPSELAAATHRATALSARSALADAPRTMTVYTPAQMRAAYGMDPAPAPGQAVSAYEAANFGAGQTLYIIGAYSDPNITAALAAFNAQWGLPSCTVVPIAPLTRLPLASANPGQGCTFSVVQADSIGGMTTTPAAYDPGWALESAMDVQWAHVMAPLARIILINAPDASTLSLSYAVKLAGRMGPGVVSMSFGSPESSFNALMDIFFTGKGMTYTAATGDYGAGALWPSASSKVIGVGGTSLNWTAGSPRTESAWSGTGGGVSNYWALPAWQAGVTVASGTGGVRQALQRRGVADVAFNADPYSGIYVGIIPPGSSAMAWYSLGGTSAATPQWAGILAVANAKRAGIGKPVLGGDAHAALYNIYRNSYLYRSAFYDVNSGSNGSCATCTATAQYDLPTGLGTPNGALVPFLSWY